MRFSFIKISLILVSLSANAFARPTTLPTLAPKAPSIAAKSYILIDYNSNQVIAESKSNVELEPASLTKMMTMYIVDNEIKGGRLSPDDLVEISNNAWSAPGSRMFVKPNSKVAVKDLIQGIIIQSGNDASIALAEHIAGSEVAFADLMNRYAKALEMNNTNFANATGLPNPKHYTTAKDMATLARAIIHDFPESYPTYAKKEFVYNGIRQLNRNQLLWRNSMVDGIKTGHTDSAGFCLVASAKNNNDMRLIAVLMGTRNEKSRSDETNKLLTWGFRFYESNLAYKANQPVQTAKIWMGSDAKLDTGFEEDLYISAPAGNYQHYTTTVSISDFIKAPIAKGDSVGTYTVKDENGKIIFERPIVALKSVSKGNAFKRSIDYVRLGIKSTITKIKS